MFISLSAYPQNESPEKFKQDTTLTLCEGVNVCRAGTQYPRSGKTYVEIYEVLTDSLVMRFGMEFRISDSTFIRKVPMSSVDRKFYDQLKAETESIIRNQESYRKKTIEFINSNRASYEVWSYFKLLGIIEEK